MTTKARHVGKHLPFLTKIVEGMIRSKEFPRTEKRAWTKEKLIFEIGGRAALADESPFRRNIASAQRSARGQWGHIVANINEKWARSEPEASVILSNALGIYCTDDPADPNIDKCFEQREAFAKGSARSGNNLRRPNQLQLVVDKMLISAPLKPAGGN
jgi:hypothetical protein